MIMSVDMVEYDERILDGRHTLLMTWLTRTTALLNGPGVLAALQAGARSEVECERAAMGSTLVQMSSLDT